MIRRKNPLLPVRIAVCVGAAILLSPTITSWAQRGPVTSEAEIAATRKPADAFSFEIGHAAKAGAVYTINATQPATSKLTSQKIRLKIVESSGVGITTRYFTFATGKYKTVAQLDATLAEVFHRFLATPAPATGQELGKIGDVKHGGEVRFIVTAADILRFDNLSPNEPVRTSEYTRTDIEGLLAALTGPPAI